MRRALSRKRLGRVVLAVLVTIVFLLLVVAGMGSLCRPSAGSMKAKCSSNLRNIAAAMVTYSRAHDGKYPDTLEELFLSSGMTSAIFVCPAGADTPAEGSPTEQAVELSAGGHLSYVYLAKGLTANDGGDDIVLAHERPDNHHGAGMNVLFGDYHVTWVEKADVPRFIARVGAGVRPVRWPPADDR